MTRILPLVGPFTLLGCAPTTSLRRLDAPVVSFGVEEALDARSLTVHLRNDGDCLKLSRSATFEVDGIVGEVVSRGGNLPDAVNLELLCAEVGLQVDLPLLDEVETSRIVLGDRGEELSWEVTGLRTRQTYEVPEHLAVGEAATIRHAPYLPGEDWLGALRMSWGFAESRDVCPPDSTFDSCANGSVEVVADGALGFVVPDLCVAGIYTVTRPPLQLPVTGTDATVALSTGSFEVPIDVGADAPVCVVDGDAAASLPDGVPVHLTGGFALSPVDADGFFGGSYFSGIYVAADAALTEGLQLGDPVEVHGAIRRWSDVDGNEHAEVVLEDWEPREDEPLALGLQGRGGVTRDEIGQFEGDVIAVWDGLVRFDADGVTVDGTRVGDRYIDPTTVLKDGVTTNVVRGVVDHDGEDWVLLPRVPSDVVP